MAVMNPGRLSFGIGNEKIGGCGGFMEADTTPEYKRYATYVRNYQAMGKTDWWKASTN